MSARLLTARSGVTLAAGAGAGALAAAAYWATMSSYSQFYGTFPYRARTMDRVVALTFDDGPNEPHVATRGHLGRRGRARDVLPGWRVH